MIKDRSILENYLEKQILKLTANTEKCLTIANYLKDRYEMSRSLVMDYLSLRTPLAEASEYNLFCILDGIEQVEPKKNSAMFDYYTFKEIDYYKSAKHENTSLEFPLVFKAIQISDNQWLSKIDIKTLMQFRSLQILNYNANAQRVMQRIVRGDKEYYKISINQSSVKAIKKLFQNNTYIPTPFTLNIPLETDYDIRYNENKMELVINSLEHFDLTDGYHRYIAACNLSDVDPDFNYTMELRIINFDEDKARHFIYQEDQKTKMKKVDSNSMNANRASNTVVTRLNESPQCNLQGLIGRGSGVINFGNLSDLVEYFYFKGTKASEHRVITLNAIKELTAYFNRLTEYNHEYLESYSYSKLIAVMCVFNYFRTMEDSDFTSIIDEVVRRTQEEIDPKKFYSRTPKKLLIKDIEKIIKEEL